MSTKEEQHFAICEKVSSELVGDLACFYTQNDCITLGITISYYYHKNGFAYELLTEVIRLFREKYPTRTLLVYPKL